MVKVTIRTLFKYSVFDIFLLKVNHSFDEAKTFDYGLPEVLKPNFERAL